jgi:hypothetical protein
MALSCEVSVILFDATQEPHTKAAVTASSANSRCCRSSNITIMHILGQLVCWDWSPVTQMRSRHPGQQLAPQEVLAVANTQIRSTYSGRSDRYGNELQKCPSLHCRASFGFAEGGCVNESPTRFRGIAITRRAGSPRLPPHPPLPAQTLRNRPMTRPAPTASRTPDKATGPR